MNDSTNKRAIIVGAGMAGLMAAAATSESFDEVLVLEKDDLPGTPELRNGVPQGAYVHTFLGYAVEGATTVSVEARTLLIMSLQ